MDSGLSKASSASLVMVVAVLLLLAIASASARPLGNAPAGGGFASELVFPGQATEDGTGAWDKWIHLLSLEGIKSGPSPGDGH